MTEALRRWTEDLNRNRVPGCDIGIVHEQVVDYVLRAFVQEVSNRADKCTFSEHLTKEGCAPIMNCLQLAYDGLVRELGLDGEGK